MRARLILSLWILSGLLAPGRVLACSQCLCGSPTPVGFLMGSSAPSWSLGAEDLYLAKSNGLGEVSGSESQVEHRLAAILAFRPSERWTLRARMPYVFKSNTRSPDVGAGSITRSHGLGDTELLLRYDILPIWGMLERTGAVAVVGTLGVPTGSNEARGAPGDRLDAHLQPGTGAFSWTGGLIFDRRVLAGAVNLSVLARLNATNSHGYHYGDAALFNFGYARTLNGDLTLAAELNGREAGFDRTEDGSRDPNTGGSVVYFTPSLRWSGLAPLGVEAMIQVPVARSLNGVQSEKGTARLALSWWR